jgi:hypothetical protein
MGTVPATGLIDAVVVGRVVGRVTHLSLARMTPRTRLCESANHEAVPRRPVLSRDLLA